MPRIHQLPLDLITKIAAGEVIERPASVVKELLENSLDAGSRRIQLDVEQGGAELIRVVDDGGGINAEDLPLAFASHATSKLASVDDLFRIGTLGFRGEALASIGGVAQVRLQSRPLDQSFGAEITCHGGQITPVQDWNGASGTRVEVRHLFYNTPVRRKFLRHTATEMGHISEMFTRLALARPGLQVNLCHNDKPVCEVSGSAELLERIGIFFGAEVRDRLFAVEAHQGPVRLSGYIGDPACERGNAKMQYLFLNGRWIRDRSLGHALQEAYRGLLMSGRYAVAFLFLEMPPDHVDVNVHPTKVEVRFREGQALHHLVFTAVRERLRKEDLTARLRGPASASWQDSPVQSGPWGSSPWRLTAPAQPPSPLPFPTRPSAAEPEPWIAPWPGPEPDLKSSSPPSTGLPHDPGMTPPRAIQVHDSYLVLETPEGMLVIDQHALHERILFEQLKGRIRAGQLEIQKLLIPEPVDLPATQAARLLEQREALAELGLEIEDFGGGTVLLTSYPALLGNRSPRAVLQSVVDHLDSQDSIPSREQFLHDVLSLMACHGAVKAGDRLSPEEIAALASQRQLAEDTHHCPHGRPTSLLFSRHELDRQFRRT